jgi:hypothetical protein
MLRIRFAIVVGLVLASSAAHAEGYMSRCFDNVHNNYDPSATMAWEQEQRLADAQAMQAIAGTWYQEIPSPQTNQIAYVTVRYSPNGIVDFQTHTCGAMNGYQSCSDDVGHGQFTARPMGDGSIFVMRNLSSSTRTNACGGAQVWVQGNQLVGSDGTRAQRVQ